MEAGRKAEGGAESNVSLSLCATPASASRPLAASQPEIEAGEGPHRNSEFDAESVSRDLWRIVASPELPLPKHLCQLPPVFAGVRGENHW